MHYVGISTYQFIPYYASAIHKHTHTRILKPFEDSEPTGLKVDIAHTHAHTHNKHMIIFTILNVSLDRQRVVRVFKHVHKNSKNLGVEFCIHTT